MMVNRKNSQPFILSGWLILFVIVIHTLLYGFLSKFIEIKALNHVLISFLFMLPTGTSVVCIIYSGIISIENNILEKQSEFYYKQCEIVQSMWENLREFKHNIENQYVCEKLMLQQGEYKELERHYDEVLGRLKYNVAFSKTGNIKLDSIINYKVSKIIEFGGSIRGEISIPKNELLDNMDLVIIIGNLLDNVIDAVEEITDIWVKINIRYVKGNLLVVVSNPYNGTRKLGKEGEYLTTKTDKKLHGIGLRSVEKLLKKYKGKMYVTHEDNVFSVKLHMYVL